MTANKDADMLVSIDKLAAGYRNHAVISFAHLDIKRGQHTLLLGPSGCGKTTLLNILAALAKPIVGTVTIDGVRIDSLGESGRDHFRGQKIGLVMQRLHLIAALTVRDNLRLTQRLAGVAADSARINTILAQLGIADKAKSYPHELSQGEAQRVAIARAVLNRPVMILADEPTSALDDRNAEAAIALLFAQVEEHGATLIVATHDARIKARFNPENVIQLGGT